jgi:hypothetical protein
MESANISVQLRARDLLLYLLKPKVVVQLDFPFALEENEF